MHYGKCMHECITACKDSGCMDMYFIVWCYFSIKIMPYKIFNILVYCIFVKKNLYFYSLVFFILRIHRNVSLIDLWYNVTASFL